MAGEIEHKPMEEHVQQMTKCIIDEINQQHILWAETYDDLSKVKFDESPYIMKEQIYY